VHFLRRDIYSVFKESLSEKTLQINLEIFCWWERGLGGSGVKPSVFKFISGNGQDYYTVAISGCDASHPDLENVTLRRLLVGLDT
jgi:hypothetical protein